MAFSADGERFRRPSGRRSRTIAHTSCPLVCLCGPPAGHCHEMTLNITILTRGNIYQSADYRLLNWTTGEVTDFETQKIILDDRYAFTATICFCGVGRTRSVDVGRWLAERVAALPKDASFDRLLKELQSADEWLDEVPPDKRRHSF